MVREEGLIDLIRRAQQGHKEARDRVARRAEGALRAYVYRVTLDHDLAQDLSQEALLEMIKSLDNLRELNRFWPWVYRLAQSKIQQYYRHKQKKPAISESVFYDGFLSQQAGRSEDDGLRHLLRDEMSKTVMTAMKDVKREYRAVLSLRCFNQMSYPDIALTMDCSEVKARVLFYRAKQALKRQLVRRGLSKGLFVMALGLFGKVTAPADAATVAVAPATTKVGLATAILAATSTKVGVATIAAAAIGLATVGSVSLVSSTVSRSSLPPRPSVSSFHYTMQERDSSWGAGSSLSKGAYEQWYYFPEGVDGPVFMRMQRWDPRQTLKRCAWLQNGEGNYYYYKGERSPSRPACVYVNNYRVWHGSMRVRRLPSDPPDLTDFLVEVEGPVSGVEYTRDRKSGLLRQAVDYRFADAPRFKTDYEYNSMAAEDFEYDWPSDVPVSDERDQMHARGWTYFRMEGQIGGRTISGRGRIPFVYQAFKQDPPWLTMDVGEGVRIIDCRKGAFLSRSDGTVIAVYPSCSFFKGLGRPWMGMHTIDIVRRDAADRRIWFDTAPAGNDKDTIVTLLDEREDGDTELVYTVDMENDIVKVIKVRLGGRHAGSLTFTYLQDIDDVEGEFVEPGLPDGGGAPTKRHRGILWLIDLAQGRIG
ncbi:MAG: RNA polymerase sigma factor [Planctomycetota bacterium]|jgi:RNA polymerase sigma-70 factor (ECF subfamily)